MDSTMLISVIIPAYNTEPFVGETLDCVSRQTYKNLQIIVVDDGSVDHTLDVVNRKAAVDPRIEIISTQNGGVSRARNIGLERVRGQKIFFFDSDDLIEPTAIEETVNFSMQNSVSSVLYGYASYIDGVKGKPHSHRLRSVYREEEITKDLIPYFLGHSYSDINNWITGKSGMREGKEETSVCRIMMDMGVIRNNNLCFDTELSLGEDTKFMNLYLLNESSVGFFNKCFYFQRKRMNGLNMTSQNNPVLMTENKLKLIRARKEIDNVAWEKKHIDISGYWQGTMVFSAIELALRLSRECEKKQGKATFNLFMSDVDVKNAVKNFKPVLGIKAMPFILLKTNPMFLYALCSALPEVLIDRIA